MVIKRHIINASEYLHSNLEVNDLVLSTREKIIEATVKLIDEKGYKGATTREIAKEAGVNEVTLFRHFGSKKGIVEAIIEKYSNIDFLEFTFEHKIVWDIEKDLKMLAREYHNLLNQKRTVILLSIREEGKFPELDNLIKQIPYKYLMTLVGYFEKMIEKGKIKKHDPHTIATNFLFVNFGYFMLNTRLHPSENHLSIDDFIDENIDFFIHSLQ